MAATGKRTNITPADRPREICSTSKVYQECINLSRSSLPVSRIDTSILLGDRVVIHVTPPCGFLSVFTSEHRRHQRTQSSTLEWTRGDKCGHVSCPKADKLRHVSAPSCLPRTLSRQSVHNNELEPIWCDWPFARGQLFD